MTKITHANWTKSKYGGGGGRGCLVIRVLTR